ncbi:hypothetical protein Glove_132g26 [Diversispora epigaea]|uniref:Uncharacterized protein n=1 Tax=Diversispora epigaea TaxID=1348612 RepID=A0A397J1J0_9GLOM|nr:hypothetical protein Glove_132g26 [Diversispora epigaea]
MSSDGSIDHSDNASFLTPNFSGDERLNKYQLYYQYYAVCRLIYGLTPPQISNHFTIWTVLKLCNIVHSSFQSCRKRIYQEQQKQKVIQTKNATRQFCARVEHDRRMFYQLHNDEYEIGIKRKKVDEENQDEDGDLWAPSSPTSLRSPQLSKKSSTQKSPCSQDRIWH